MFSNEKEDKDFTEEVLAGDLFVHYKRLLPQDLVDFTSNDVSDPAAEPFSAFVLKLRFYLECIFLFFLTITY